MTSVLANNGPFQMASARGILARAGGAIQIRQQVEAIEEAVIEDRRNHRPDIVVFLNGLPLSVIELKNPADEKVTIRHPAMENPTLWQKALSNRGFSAVESICPCCPA